jgi:hypothetical protein
MLSNSVTFGRKPIGPEEFFNQRFEDLGIIIEERPKGGPRKIES